MNGNRIFLYKVINLHFNFISLITSICMYLLQYGSTESCDKNNDRKGVHTWASGFEKLLEDPKGLQTFAVSLTVCTISSIEYYILYMYFIII